jgi:hypothetical protein
MSAVDSWTPRRQPRAPLKTPVGRLTRDEATCIIRSIFRRCGYAIAEHGTRGRDLDLVAVPWTDRAGLPHLIVDEVLRTLPGWLSGDPEQKPHGRIAYAIWPELIFGHDMWYLDLSVMPPADYLPPVIDNPGS